MKLLPLLVEAVTEVRVWSPLHSTVAAAAGRIIVHKRHKNKRKVNNLFMIGISLLYIEQ